MVRVQMRFCHHFRNIVEYLLSSAQKRMDVDAVCVCVCVYAAPLRASRALGSVGKQHAKMAVPNVNDFADCGLLNRSPSLSLSLSLCYVSVSLSLSHSLSLAAPATASKHPLPSSLRDAVRVFSFFTYISRTLLDLCLPHLLAG